MATKIYANARFGIREDTLENWTANNPVLERGEPAAVRDGSETEWLKIGDGVTPFNDLPWKKGPKGDKGEKGEKGDKGADADLTYINSTFAGSLKGKASGEVIRLDDVSPVEHEVNVTLESVNLAVPNGFVVENNGMTATTNPDGTITVTGSVADGTKATLLQLIFRKHEASFITLELGQIYKLVVKKDGTSILAFGTKTVYTDTGEVYWGTVETTDITRPRKVQLVYLQKNLAEGDTSLCGTYTVQLVKGTMVGEYTPYVNIENVTLTVNGNTYSPEIDGTVKGVVSASPTMTFTTDTAGVIINCGYNRDINAALVKDLSAKADKTYVDNKFASMESNVSDVSGKKWRDIADITLTEDALPIINEDADGNAFKLKEFRIAVYTTIPKDWSYSTLWLRCVLEGNAGYLGMAYCNSLYNNRTNAAYFHGLQCPYWEIYSYREYTDMFLSGVQHFKRIENGNIIERSGNITEIMLAYEWEKALPSGTRVVVQGVDADEEV